MQRLISWLLITVAVVVGMARAVWHRLMHGPTVDAWTWTMELRRAALAAGIRTAVERSDPHHWATVKGSAPLPWPMRRRVWVGDAVCGGVPGEWTRVHDGDPDDPVLLYLHGGGYVVGSPAMERPFITRLALATGAGHVFSADYRLAPRHRYPAAVDDAVAAYHGMLAGGVEPSRLVVVGDSAGGGLAMALLVTLRNAGEALPAGAVLLSPWVDLANTASTIETNAATDYLPAIAGRPAIEYLGDTDPTEPTASPLYAELSGLPPLLILAGGVEMILEDSQRLAERAYAAGVDVTLEIEPDMFHVWPVIVPGHPASARAIDTAATWIRKVAAR